MNATRQRTRQTGIKPAPVRLSVPPEDHGSINLRLFPARPTRSGADVQPHQSSPTMLSGLAARRRCSSTRAQHRGRPRWENSEPLALKAFWPLQPVAESAPGRPVSCGKSLWSAKPRQGTGRGWGQRAVVSRRTDHTAAGGQSSVASDQIRSAASHRPARSRGCKTATSQKSDKK